ncbi:M48 family metallopeptidase [Streptomyces sp. NPDC051940]|uniref:M48 family metallopeptidase n=1 Tax=Streptomyces sp. NPDC051940 TaxID=3155675 RepID=UPI00342E2ACA
MAARVVASGVHLTTGGIAVGGGLLIGFGWETGIQPFVGIGMIALAYELHPRRDRTQDSGESLLQRADAPEHFALLDEVADAVGTHGFDTVRLDAGYAIRATPYGLGHRRLDIGLALWETLTPAQRIACVAHELGRFAEHDVRHNVFVRTTVPLLGAPSDRAADDSDALREQSFATSPYSRFADEMAEAAATFRVTSAMSRWVMWLPARLLGRTARLAHRLAVPVAEEAAVRADAVAARVASTEAAVQALVRSRHAGAVLTELERMAVEARTFKRKDVVRELWGRLAAFAAGLAEPERGSDAVSARIALLGRDGPHAALVAVDAAASAAMDGELAEVKQAVAERFVRDSV